MAGTFFKHGALVESTATTATAAGTTTLTNASSTNQQFTGTSTQTVKLPDATTMSAGRRFRILNRSTQLLTVNYSDNSLLGTIAAGTQSEYLLTSNGTAVGSWDVSTSSGSGSSAGATFSVVAGEALAANDATYISTGAGDGGRTAGRAYKLDPTNALRYQFAGFATTAISSGATGSIQNGGVLSGFTGLTTNAYQYGSITSPGAMQTTEPTTLGSYVVILGFAMSATELLINGAAGDIAYKVQPDQQKLINYVVNPSAETDTGGWTAYNQNQTFTVTLASPGVFTSASAHNFAVGQPVAFGTTGALPTGLTANTTYYVSAIPSSTTFRVSATLGGADVNTSVSQSGTHTMRPVIPTIATGGAHSGLAFTRSTSSPLRRNASFLLTQTNSTVVQGQGVYYNLTIDSADQAKMLSVQVDYNASSTFVCSSGAVGSESDLEFFLLDVTNGALIPLSTRAITAGGANNYTFRATFQSASNSTSYRLMVHAVNASANATGWTFKFDNVSVGPSTGGSAGAVAPTVQKFTSGTALTYVTPSNPAPLYLRVRVVGGGGGGNGSGVSGTGSQGTDGGASTFGTSLVTANGGIKSGGVGGAGGAGGTATLGTGASGLAQTGGSGTGGAYTSAVNSTIPGGMGGSNALGGGGGGGNYGAVGLPGATNSGGGGGGAGAPNTGTPDSRSGSGGGAGGYAEAIIVNPAATYTYTVGAGGTGGAAGTSGFAGGAGAAGYIEVTEYYAAPGNSAADGDGRPVQASAKGASTTLATGAATTVIFGTTVKDTHAGYNSSTGVYTVPVSGDYLVSSNIYVTSGSFNNNVAIPLNLAKNGTAQFTNSNQCAAGTQGAVMVCVTGIISCVVGDLITATAGGTAAWSGSAQVSSTNSSLCIQRLNGSSSSSESVSVNARYVGSTSSISSSTAQVDYTTKVQDTHNAYSSGVYRIPISGTYDITAKFVTACTSASAATSSVSMGIYKNGVLIDEWFQYWIGSAAQQMMVSMFAPCIPLLVGDLITVKASNNATGPTITNDANRDIFTIKKVGN